MSGKPDPEQPPETEIGTFVAVRTETIELVLLPGSSPGTVRYRIDVRPGEAVEIER